MPVVEKRLGRFLRGIERFLQHQAAGRSVLPCIQRKWRCERAVIATSSSPRANASACRLSSERTCDLVQYSFVCRPCRPD